jgi:hypothetical protein
MPGRGREVDGKSCTSFFSLFLGICHLLFYILLVHCCAFQLLSFRLTTFVHRLQEVSHICISWFFSLIEAGCHFRQTSVLIAPLAAGRHPCQGEKGSREVPGKTVEDWFRVPQFNKISSWSAPLTRVSARLDRLPPIFPGCVSRREPTLASSIEGCCFTCHSNGDRALARRLRHTNRCLGSSCAHSAFATAFGKLFPTNTNLEEDPSSAEVPPNYNFRRSFSRLNFLSNTQNVEQEERGH